MSDMTRCPRRTPRYTTLLLRLCASDALKMEAHALALSPSSCLVWLCVCVRVSMCMTSASHTARAVPVPTGATEHVPRPSTPTRAQSALHPRCCYMSASGAPRTKQTRVQEREGASGGSEQREGGSERREQREGGSHNLGLAASETASCYSICCNHGNVRRYTLVFDAYIYSMRFGTEP